MFGAHLAEPADFEGWRRQARVLAQREIPPGDIVWHVGDEPMALFVDQPANHLACDPLFRLNVPREFLDLAEQVVCHRDPERFGLPPCPAGRRRRPLCNPRRERCPRPALNHLRSRMTPRP